MEDENKPKISPVEKGLVIGATGVVDLIQWGLNALALTGIGAIITVIGGFLIDIVTGLSLWLYCKLRGVNMNWKRTVSILLGAFLEVIPALNIAPLWTIDAAYLLLSSDVAKVVEKVPGGKQVVEAVKKVDKAV